eukprot:TRINITY_DN56344_c0_g1_i1.p1 TRINITY_DN56344_c0_g1~~TRINITY_DN56344_c0_g1_i1.p1  ORF type:complete len:519 (+),score=51.39 TRINITY_DN56344_c0_g1_i1:68-1558(+)
MGAVACTSGIDCKHIDGNCGSKHGCNSCNVSGLHARRQLNFLKCHLEFVVDRVVVNRKRLVSPWRKWLSGKSELLYVEITPNYKDETSQRTQAGKRLKSVESSQGISNGVDEVWVWNATPEGDNASPVDNKLTFDVLTSTEFVLQIIGREEKGWFGDPETVEHLAEARFRPDEDFVPVVGCGGSLALPLVQDSRVRGAVTMTVALRCEGPTPTPSCPNGTFAVRNLNTDEDEIVGDGDDTIEKPCWQTRFRSGFSTGGLSTVNKPDRQASASHVDHTVESPKSANSEPTSRNVAGETPSISPFRTAAPLSPSVHSQSNDVTSHLFLAHQDTDPMLRTVLPMPVESEKPSPVHKWMKDRWTQSTQTTAAYPARYEPIESAEEMAETSPTRSRPSHQSVHHDQMYSVEETAESPATEFRPSHHSSSEEHMQVGDSLAEGEAVPTATRSQPPSRQSTGLRDTHEAASLPEHDVRVHSKESPHAEIEHSPEFNDTRELAG